MFKKTIVAATLAIASVGVASAAGIGFGIGAYAAGGAGYATGATAGGSMAQGEVSNTGFTVQATTNQSQSWSGAGASYSPVDVNLTTYGGSTSYNMSGGFTAGNAVGSTAGMAGSDFTSNAWGGFGSGYAGFGIGNFGAFTGFGNSQQPR